MARLGLAITIIAALSFIIALGLPLFTDVSSARLDNLVGVSQYGIAFGIVFTLVFGRLGWLEHRLTDFFMNRISIVFTIVGFVMIVIGDIKYDSSSLIWTGVILGGAGILLALLGIRYQIIPSE